eukprot:TRINITY_DN7265_c0_g3_i1.p1 TRINITY_DN7265_c0_g3~~TRINITY_DN7265_c0_g3_i1.p1  ORF type:complete len:479 (+),score=142.34 TRINITY_DN7265_c0_g3_i1:1755-3191(+)
MAATDNDLRNWLDGLSKLVTVPCDTLPPLPSGTANPRERRSARASLHLTSEQANAQLQAPARHSVQLTQAQRQELLQQLGNDRTEIKRALTMGDLKSNHTDTKLDSVSTSSSTSSTSTTTTTTTSNSTSTPTPTPTPTPNPNQNPTPTPTPSTNTSVSDTQSSLSAPVQTQPEPQLIEFPDVKQVTHDNIIVPQSPESTKTTEPNHDTTAIAQTTPNSTPIPTSTLPDFPLLPERSKEHEEVPVKDKRTSTSSENPVVNQQLQQPQTQTQTQPQPQPQQIQQSQQQNQVNKQHREDTVNLDRRKSSVEGVQQHTTKDEQPEQKQVVPDKTTTTVPTNSTSNPSIPVLVNESLEQSTIHQDNSAYEQKLKTANSKISSLEEQLFLARLESRNAQKEKESFESENKKLNEQLKELLTQKTSLDDSIRMHHDIINKLGEMRNLGLGYAKALQNARNYRKEMEIMKQNITKLKETKTEDKTE